MQMNGSAQQAAADEWEAMIRSLHSPDPEPALKQIGNKITFVDPRIALHLPFGEICRVIDDVLKTARTKQLIDSAVFCIRKLAETLDNAEQLFSRTSILLFVRQYMMANISPSISENCLYIFHSIAKTKPAELGKAVGIEPMIRCMNKFDQLNQRNTFLVMCRITDKYVDNQMAAFLKKIGKFFTHHDMLLVSYAIKTFMSISKAADINLVPVDVISQIAVALLVITDIGQVMDLISILTHLVERRELLVALFNSPMDLNSVIAQTQTNGREVDFFEKITELILQSLKRAKIFQIEIISNFIGKVYLIIVDIIMEQRTMSAEKSLLCLMYIVEFAPNTNISALYQTFASIVMSGNLAPIILKIIMKTSDRRLLAKTSLPSVFIKAKDNVSDDVMFKRNVDILIDELGKNGFFSFPDITSFSSFNEMYDLLIKKQIPSLDFVNMNGIEASLEFLKKYRGSINDEHEDVLKALIKAAHEVLNSYPIQHEDDPFHSERDLSFERKAISVDIKFGLMVEQKYRIEITADFAAIESWYNRNIKRISFPLMLGNIQKNPITSHLTINANEHIPPSKLAVLNRASQAQFYTKCSFKIGTNVFSSRDNVFQSICKTCDKPEMLKTCSPVIEIIENDAPRSAFSIPVKPAGVLSQLLELLSQIKRISNLNVECPSFSAHIAPALSSIVLTHGGFSLASSLIFNYPFAFTLNDRISFLRIAGMDMSSSIYYIYQKFVKPDAGRSKTEMKYQCTIKRDRILEDGSEIIKAFGPSMGILEVSFIGEVGIGYGPTQEFFTLFSHEMCKTSHRLWRSSGDREFAFSDDGLYPSPTANPDHLYTLGVLCAKCLATQFLVDIPLSPAFIRTCRGETVPIYAIDPLLSNSLKSPEGLIGLDFTYPGIPNFELVSKGFDVEVTEGNLGSYVSLIEQYTCGEKMIKLCQNFVKGFNQVIPWEMMSIFTPDEFLTLLSGSGTKITEMDLRDNVLVGSGYSKNSPQIQQLFDSIMNLDENDLSLFVQFITGTKRLPIGGLAGLQPKLTIAVRTTPEGKSPDVSLPSVLTCFNYFKLPTYSSKDILDARLKTAIRECQGSFDFT